MYGIIWEDHTDIRPSYRTITECLFKYVKCFNKVNLKISWLIGHPVSYVYYLLIWTAVLDEVEKWTIYLLLPRDNKNNVHTFKWVTDCDSDQMLDWF